MGEGGGDDVAEGQPDKPPDESIGATGTAGAGEERVLVRDRGNYRVDRTEDTGTNSGQAGERRAGSESGEPAEGPGGDSPESAAETTVPAGAVGRADSGEREVEAAGGPLEETQLRLADPGAGDGPGVGTGPGQDGTEGGVESAESRPPRETGAQVRRRAAGEEALARQGSGEGESSESRAGKGAEALGGGYAEVRDPAGIPHGTVRP